MTQTNAQTRFQTWAPFVVVACAFVLRILPWVSSALWYDEVLTLQRFVLPHEDDLLEIFRDYPIANNHFLCTFITALWMPLFNNGLVEWLIRLPSVAFGLCAVAVVFSHWRRFVGDRVAFLGALALAVSPIFGAYAYQLRGYSLTMLLVTLALSGALEYTAENASSRRRLAGQCVLCAAGLFLPLTIPTNGMALVPVGVLLFCLEYQKTQAFRSAILSCVPWTVACCLGGAYYLTLLPQVRHAFAEPDGWSSAWMVFGNVLLGFGLHGAGLLVFAAKPLFSKAGRTACAVLAATCLTVAMALLVSRGGHAPYPRVFVVFLPVVTLALMLAARQSAALTTMNAMTPALLIVLIGVLTVRVSDVMAHQQRIAGNHPDNLLQQYYRGDGDVRFLAQDAGLDMRRCIILTDAYDYMAAQFYVAVAQPPVDKEAPNGLVLAANALTPAVREACAQRLSSGDSTALYVLAHSIGEANANLETLALHDWKDAKEMDISFPSRERKLFRAEKRSE